MAVRQRALTTKEILSGIPKLNNYFRNLDATIRNLDTGTGYNPKSEELKAKREKLLRLLRDMSIVDLQAVEYIRTVQAFSPCRLMGILRKLNEMIRELSEMPEELQNTVSRSE